MWKDNEAGFVGKKDPRSDELGKAGRAWSDWVVWARESTENLKNDGSLLKHFKLGWLGWVWRSGSHSVCVLATQSCPAPCDPMACSPPGSSVFGILQARILEWVGIPFSRGPSWHRDRTWVSRIAGRFLYSAWLKQKSVDVVQTNFITKQSRELVQKINEDMKWNKANRLSYCS